MEDHYRGNPIWFDETVQKWKYSDDNSLVENTHKTRSCGMCNKFPTKEGHDPCLGTIPKAVNACCGHGDESTAYIQFEDGKIITGNAVTEFKNCLGV